MSDQTPAQRMAEIEQSLEDCAANRRPFGPGRDEMRWLIARCKKLEKVAEHARCVYYGRLWEDGRACPVPCRECAICKARTEAGYAE